jgi:hypothetical protein
LEVNKLVANRKINALVSELKKAHAAFFGV